MPLVIRPLFLFTLVAGGGAAYWLKDQAAPNSHAASPSEVLVVWSGEKPVGQTWAKLGPKGFIKVTTQAGVDGKSSALTICMDGDGYRGCGLNWKGWHPPEACDDASPFRCLSFYVRQMAGPGGSDIAVTLVDNVKEHEGSAVSNSVFVVGDGGAQRIDGEWRLVLLPLDRFARNKPLKLDRLWGINFASQGPNMVTFQIDRIAFTNDPPPGPRFPKHSGYTATARLTAQEPTHRIRDEIYGVCGLPRDKLAEFGIPITRWGGNPSSRYNWKINADNGAADWYFKNRGSAIKEPTETGWLKLIHDNQAIGATSYQTVPMLGWVAKDHESYAFSVKKYGKQKAVEPGHDDIGNGLQRDGKRLTGNDPNDTSIPDTPEFIAEGMRLVVQQAGTAERGGVRYWVLDNEPMLWNSTHRDVRPKPLGYDELWERTVAYAEAIRREDPTAKIAGFCSWGWTDLFYSAADEGGDRYGAKLDHRNHGSVPLAEWFLMKCAEYKKRTGKPLIDVFDFHWYPQAQARGKGPYMGKGMDQDLNELRLRTTRDLWDPKYDPESWIGRSGDGKPTAVIRRVREWIDKHAPGMKLCLGEYNFGGGDNITGGLAQADAFGILAREKVDLAFIWHTPEGSQNLAWQLFRSYDRKGSRFGDRFLPAESDNPDLGIYAAKRFCDGATTIVVINKNLGSACELSLDLPGVKGKMRVWRFDQDSGDRVMEAPKEAAKVDGTMKLTLPAASASILVIE